MKDERVKQIYDELNRYEIELASDPVSLGPKYLQELIATCRNYMTLVTKLLMEVNLEKQLAARELNAAQTLYDVEADELLANDERVRRAPNIKDREAIIKTLLQSQLRTISVKKAAVNDLTYIEKAVKHKHQELKDTMDAIKMQKSLINAEISTGAMYGDERAPGQGTRSPPLTPPEMLDDDEVMSLLDPANPAADSTPKTTTAAEEPAADTAAETSPSDVHNPAIEDLVASHVAADEDVAKFLGSKIVEDDFSSLLD